MRKRSDPQGKGDNSVAQEMLEDGDDQPYDALVFDSDGNLLTGGDDENPTEFVKQPFHWLKAMSRRG